MKAFFYTDDTGGCLYYRLQLPAQTLNELGHEVQVKDSAVCVMREDGTLEDGEPWADAYVIQRPANPMALKLIASRSRKGRRTLVEFDDALDIVPPFNEAQNRIKQANQDPGIMLKAIHAAHGAICSTRELGERYRPLNADIRVLENCVDLSVWPVHRQQDGTLVVGWSGSATHLGDIALLRGWIEGPIKRHRAVFRIGGAIGYSQLFPLLEVEEQPWVSIEDWPRTIAALDIGLAPLSDNAFNLCKSHLKPLEFAAAGIPCIVSDLPNYRRFVKHGETGFIVKHRRDWTKYLDLLLRDGNLRAEMGAAARAHAEGYDIRRHAGEWEEAIFG